MRRSEARERAIDAALDRYRETCQRIYKSDDTSPRGARYALAKQECRDALYKAMRRESTPQVAL